jgi:hypothetical protein
MTTPCRCGYRLPRVTVQLGTLVAPPEFIRVILECPRCESFYEIALPLAGTRSTPPAVRIAMNARGGVS